MNNTNMDEQIFLSTLLYKSILENRKDTIKHVSYKVLGPMMGTLDKKVFINTKDKEYNSIEERKTNMDDNIRYAYYNLISLKEAKEKYGTDNLEELVKKYYDDYKIDCYYVMNSFDSEPLIMRYDPEKFKKVYDSEVAHEIV